jgi:predicted molibdopterin-dependent oxidoreductase YjgC
MRLLLNGRAFEAAHAEPGATLLQVLRNDALCNGPKFGCGLGQCGACTVLVDGRVARACGCLCSLDMDYNSRSPNSLKQAHGWAYGILCQQTGDYFVWQAESINNKWVLPSDIVEIG